MDLQTQFLNDVKNHQLTVIRDDGTDRRIRLQQPGTRIHFFDLITWPGHLCITGDCGTYVFSRVEDMFTFFRAGDVSDGIPINPGYWGEKLLSIGTNAGYREFDPDRFKERVREHFEEWAENSDPDDFDKSDMWESIECDVLRDAEDGEIFAYTAVQNFDHNGFVFQDFFDGGGTERYTVHYLWNLYAIVWGIAQYDACTRKAA